MQSRSTRLGRLVGIVVVDRRIFSFGANDLTSNLVAADVSLRHLRSLKVSADSRPPSASSTRRCTSSAPHEDAEQNDLAKKMGMPVAKIKQRVKELHEFNPMLGFRGCRLGIVLLLRKSSGRGGSRESCRPWLLASAFHGGQSR